MNRKDNNKLGKKNIKLIRISFIKNNKYEKA